jgi:hypothetical protein
MVDIDRKIGFEAGVDAMYSALKDQIEWVSVEDRLPEYGGEKPVLVKSVHNCITCAYFIDGEWEVHWEYFGGKITHWRSI